MMVKRKPFPRDIINFIFNYNIIVMLEISNLALSGKVEKKLQASESHSVITVTVMDFRLTLHLFPAQLTLQGPEFW